MNCVQARVLLPGLLYDDLAAEKAVAVKMHLDQCPDCQKEYGALTGVRHLLNAAAKPDIQVDLTRVYQEAGRRQEKRLRRWRRAALAVGAVAAGLLLAVMLKWELRVEGHHLVVRWGASPTPNAPAPTEPSAHSPVVAVDPLPTVTVEEMQLLKDLVHALADDADGRDRRQQETLAVLESRLDSLHRQTHDRWTALERDFAALYADRFVLTKKGD